MELAKKQSFLVQLAFLAALAALFWLSFRFVLPWLLPFLIAFGLAAAMEPAIAWCRRRLGFQRGFSAAVFTLVLVAGLFLGVYWLFAQLLRQAYGFFSQLPTLLTGLPTMVDSIQHKAQLFCAACPQELQDWLSSFSDDLANQGAAAAVKLSSRAVEELSSFMGQLPRGVLFFVTTLLAVFYTACHYPAIRDFLIRQLPTSLRKSLPGLRHSVSLTLGRWLRAEALLVAVAFFFMLAGFLLLREEYALLLAFLIAIVDALPILGAGTVLVPWSLVCFLTDDIPKGIAILALYALILLVRSLLEPKLMADQAGLPPVTSLLAMYLGYCTMGLLGMLLFPVLLLLIKQLHDAGYLRLWK